MTLSVGKRVLEPRYLYPGRSTLQVLLVGSAGLCLLLCSSTSSSSPATLPDSSIQDITEAIKPYAKYITEP
jgi:hypothetical protein